MKTLRLDWSAILQFCNQPKGLSIDGKVSIGYSEQLMGVGCTKELSQDFNLFLVNISIGVFWNETESIRNGDLGNLFDGSTESRMLAIHFVIRLVASLARRIDILSLTLGIKA